MPHKGRFSVNQDVKVGQAQASQAKPNANCGQDVKVFFVHGNSLDGAEAPVGLDFQCCHQIF